jgi:hypothetical protein
MRLLHHVGVAVTLAGLALSAGCSGDKTGGASDPAVDKQMDADLKRIGIAYHLHFDAKRKGPATGEDLGPFLENDQRLLGLLKSGDIVFIYNVGILDMDGTSDTVVAYDKNVPTKGGMVLMGDAVTKRMSADEFKKAKVAKPK